MLRRLGALALLGIALVASPARAQDPLPVTVAKPTLAPAEVAPGKRSAISVELTIEPGWHVYGLAEKTGIPTAIKVKQGTWPEGLSGGRLAESKTPHEYDTQGIIGLVHEADVVITLPVLVAADAQPGPRTIAGYVEYMACDDKRCLPPSKVPFEVTLEVLAAGAGEEPAAAPEPGARVKAARFVAAEVVPGATAVVEVEFEVDDGWYLYALEHENNQPPTFRWKLPDGFTAGKLTEVSKPKEKDVWGERMRVHEKKLVLHQTIVVGPDVAGGVYDIAATAKWQHCNPQVCVPTIAQVQAKLRVLGDPVDGAGGANGGATAKPPPKAATPSEASVRIVSATFRKSGLTRGQKAVLDVEVEVPEGWTVVTTGDAGPKLSGKRPSGFGQPEYLGPAPGTAGGPLSFAFEIKDSVSLGKQEFQPALDWTATDGKLQQSGKTATEASLEVVSQGVTAARIVQAFVLGLLTLLTPCVFPLLPVTVSFFSKQEGPAAPRSIVYGLGIVFTITVVGLIFKSSLDVFARGTTFNLLVAALFIVLSFSLFGMFDLRVPSFLIDASAKRSGGGGYMGAFFMAVTLALTSFSCSLPFLAALFADFEQGDQLTATLLLIVYSVTMAAPFVFCSLFPTMLQSLPGAGGWMNAIKVTMGFVEFAMAFKFIRGAALAEGWEWMPRSLVLSIWVACSLGAALYLFGYLVLPHDTKVESIGVVRLLWAVFFLSSAFYLMPGVWGHPVGSYIDGFILTQPEELVSARGPTAPGPGGHETASSQEVHWPRNDWDGALARAAARGVPVLFDFTGVG